MWKIFRTFLLLGTTSFGGPVAHIGYFHRAFVNERQWLSDEEFSRLLALCQFLPGPASSQLGFAIGYRQGGMKGAIAAFAGFTLPSFLLMWALAVFAMDSGAFQDAWSGIIHGLKLLAVIVVTDAVLSMYCKFCVSALTRFLCYLAAVLLLLMPGIWMQLLVILMGAIVGWCCTNSLWSSGPQHSTSLPGTGSSTPQKNHQRWFESGLSIHPLLWFVGLMLLLPVVAALAPVLGLFSDFYLAGSWVFGGGHVVLPLLQGLVGEAVSQEQFLTGYAAAQAVPGPMFTMATYLGATLMTEHALWGALVATIAIFLPGFLLLLGLQKAWLEFSANQALQSAVAGINGAVVGLLASALYTPVFTTAVSSGTDLAVVAVGFFLLRLTGLPVLWLVGGMIGLGLIFW